MTNPSSTQTSNPFMRWLSGPKFTAKTQLLQEKAQLEAFLSAFPGEYCGWSSTDDTHPIYSGGFCDVFGLDQISTIIDIQNTITPGDSAALESLFSRLKKQGKNFSVTAQSLDQTKTFKITGAQGTDLSNTQKYFILWAEDVTDEIKARHLFVEESQTKEQKLDEYKAAMDAVPRPLWIRDGQQTIIWVNDTYADFLGTPADRILSEQKEIFGQLRGRKKETLKDAHGLTPGPALAQKALHDKQPLQIRVHNTIKGKRMLLNITETPVASHNMTLGIAYNVTREEELENKLARYTSANRELLEKLRSAIAMYNADQRLEFHNTAFAQLWGLEDTWLNQSPKLGDLMEKLRETRRLPEQADFRKFKKTWLDMFTGLIDPHEDMLYLPDGTALRMLVVPNSTGGLMMTFEDVTDRLALESSYNTLIAVQKETLDNLAEAVAVYGGDGRLKLCNPAFGRLWHLNPEDLEGEPHISTIVEKKKTFFSADLWPSTEKIMRAQALDRSVQEGRLTLKDDALIDYVSVPLPDGGVLITYEDVTDKAHVENALREKNAALETAEKLKLDFLANVSYQLRTPLNAIMGFNEILENEYFGSLNPRQKSYTQDIKTASNRLLGLINDILDLSTLEAGYMDINLSDISIHKLLHNVHDLVAEWARKEKIELHLQCPKNIGKAAVDERRIQQAIINIIRNALSHTPEGGHIKLIGKRTKDGATITVSDNGVGIPAEKLDSIFEPFETVKSKTETGKTPTKINSTTGNTAGLGLALVKNIMELHNGTVSVDSTEGKGTTVTLFIPFGNVSEE